MKSRTTAGLALLLAAAVAAQADDWPHWRGPEHNGISSETQWLDHWPAAGPPIAWRARVGTGFSSFAIAEGRAFTMGNADNRDTVWCLDTATGDVLWTHGYEAELGDKYFEGGTTGTPTVDAGRVFTLSRWGDVFCFEAATGKVIWKKNVQQETGVRVPGWGFSGSPLRHQELLVLNVGDAGLALNAATGAIVWQSANKDAGYSTPRPVRLGGQWCALLGSGQSYLAVDLKTGRELWRVRWLTQYGVNAADPIISGDHVFISTGYGKGGGLFQLGAAVPEPLWRTKALRTQLNPAVLFDGHLYGTDGDTTDRASLKCLDFSTGTEKWSQPGIGTGGLMIANGRLIVLSAAGELMVAPASPAGFSPVARAQVLGGKSWTAPVLAGGRIFCRNSRGEVVAVDVRARNATQATSP